MEYKQINVEVRVCIMCHVLRQYVVSVNVKGVQVPGRPYGDPFPGTEYDICTTGTAHVWSQPSYYGLTVERDGPDGEA